MGFILRCKVSIILPVEQARSFHLGYGSHRRHLLKVWKDRGIFDMDEEVNDEENVAI